MVKATRQVGRAMFWSVGAKAARFLLGLASSVIVVRALGKDDYGVLSLMRVTLVIIGMFAGLGLFHGVLKFLPVLKVAGDGRGARILVRRVIVVQTAAWLLLVGVSYLLADRFESFFEFEGIGRILWISVGLLIFELAWKLVSQILNAYYDTKLLSGANVLAHTVFIAVLLVLLPMGYGVLGVFAATAAGNVAGTLMVVRKVWTNLHIERPQGESAGVNRMRVLKFSLPFALIGILNVIVWRQSETLFLAHFRTAAEVGFFDLAYRLPQTILEFIPVTVWPIILAGVSEAYARDRKSLNEAIDRYYRMLFLLTAPICAMGVALGGRVIAILYSDAMMPAALPTQLFFAIFPISFFGTPLSMALYVVEKSHVNLLIYTVLAVINVGLDLILIPRYGVIGAIIPVALVITLQPFLYRYVLSRYVDGTRIPFGFIGKCFLASSPVLLMLPFTGLIEGVVELSVAVVLACVVILFSVKKLRIIGRRELDMIGPVPIPAVDKFLRFVSS
jgi:O-antigen/teichoic acid export membrane protein